MKRLFRFVTQRWVISTIGIIALLVLIWFGGPYLGIADTRPLTSAQNRLLLIMIVLVLWGANNLRLRLKSAKNNDQLINELVAEPVPALHPGEQNQAGLSDDELNTIRQRFEAALDRLKRTRFRGKFGKQQLYELPWYVIIGPPGSGKTTLLENCGLEFPLAAHDMDKRIEGVGGTRNCDWWFADEAVFIDTAGRYTTQDSHGETDSRAWLGFLDLLQKYRPRRPLNGIIIGISVSDLLSQSEQERDHHAQTIRQRVQELYTRLGIRLPVYVLFTKCDLVAGFTEYFDDLNKEERKQVWGMTFPEGDIRRLGEVVHLFGGEFDALVNRLNARMLHRLHQERDQSRRDLIYRFPQQMAGLKSVLNDFLQKAFRLSQYEQPPWLRGIYFTSGTQEGSPFDRIMAGMASTFGLNLKSLTAYHGHPRSYFITRLLSHVVFREADLAGGNVRYERTRLWIQRGAYAAAIALTLVIILAWSFSFTRNEYYLTRLNNRIDKYNVTVDKLDIQPTDNEMLSVLEYAKDASTVYSEKSPSLSGVGMGMGLYQGYKLEEASKEAYSRVLNMVLVSHVKRRLERAIRLSQGQDVRGILEIYKSLSVYLMLGEPDTFDPKRFRSWVTKDWERRLPDSPEAQRQFTDHLDSLLKTSLAPQELDNNLMTRARRLICSMTLPEQIYVRLEQLSEAADIPPFRTANLGRQAREILDPVSAEEKSSRVPGFYTYDGYHEILIKEGPKTAIKTVKELRQLCEDKERELELADTEQILREVRRRYYTNYTEHWNRYLESVQLRGFKDLEDAAKVLEVLASPGSPLEELTIAITRHTRLEQSQLAGVLERFDATREFAERKSDPVQDEFVDVHRLLRKREDDTTRLDDVLGELRALRGYVDEIADSADDENAFKEAKARLEERGKDDIIRKLRSEGNRLPVPLGNLVKTAAVETWGVILAGARRYLNAIWQSTVLQQCQSSMEGRYPLSNSANRDTTFADFGKFFGDNGAIDGFIRQYLLPFIDPIRWNLREMDQRDLGLASESLAHLKRAANIRSMFFQSGGQEPKLQFNLKPLFLDPRVGSFLLDLHGQQIGYRHGPQRELPLEWPGPKDTAEVRLVFERVDGSRTSVVKRGPWAWFKLLDESNVDQLSGGDRVVITFKASSLEARYQLRANSVNNPFSGEELTGFHCPEKL